MNAAIDGQRVAEGARLRAEAWGLLAAALEYPDEELIALARDGALMRRARELIGTLDPTLDATLAWSALAEVPPADGLAIEYSRLFDAIGPGGPACPLHSGVLLGEDGRMKLLEELVRFYNHFGLTAAGAPGNEFPDHVLAQLDFLQFLNRCEAECLREGGEGADDYRRACADFRRRHPARWSADLIERLERHHAHPYYLTIARLIHHLATQPCPGAARTYRSA